MIVNVYGDRREQEVMQATWGHLAPKSARRYSGAILFAHSAYGGERVLIDANFAGLDDSPWLFEDMQRFIEAAKTAEGRVYRWTGTYSRDRRGEPLFVGTFAELAREDGE